MQQELIRIITEILKCDRKSLMVKSRFVEDLGADSLDIVELILEIEKTFDVELPDDININSINTIGKLYIYLKENADYKKESA